MIYDYNLALHAYGINVSHKGDYSKYPLFKDYGKISLDSIVTVHDSEMVQESYFPKYVLRYNLFTLPAESLYTIVGRCYAIKTLLDMREGLNFYAKIKILGVDVQDSAIEYTKMIILWACQIDGSNDLNTTNLDTFNLNVASTTEFKKTSNSNIILDKPFKKITGNSIVLPIEVADKVKIVEIYSLNGKLLGSWNIENISIINLKELNISDGIKFVKYRF